MTEGLFLAGSVLVPLVFGLIPGFLPVAVPQLVRWVAWLAALVLTGWYGYAMEDAPTSYRALAWGAIGVSAALSFIVLVAETERARRSRRAS